WRNAGSLPAASPKAGDASGGRGGRAAASEIAGPDGGAWEVRPPGEEAEPAGAGRRGSGAAGAGPAGGAGRPGGRGRAGAVGGGAAPADGGRPGPPASPVPGLRR